MIRYRRSGVNDRMKIGAHISGAGGLWNAPLNAARFELECFQFFSRPPQGGRVKPIDVATADRFLAACGEHAFTQYYIHAPYIVNLASKEERIRNNTVEIMRGELDRGTVLHATGMMTHLGSASSIGDERKGIALTIEGLKRVLDGYDGTTQLLLEISAGAGMVIGDTFEELAEILAGIGDRKVGICLDTAHMFASGYDLRTPEAVAATMKEFDDVVGLDRLAVSHFNDSKIDIGEHKDRHAHLGEGFIGTRGCEAIVTSPIFKDVNLILETPHEDTIETLGPDIEFVKRTRGNI